ncbi:hypothetical protein ACYPKM_05560 [Pseudomonas aeruginosa]
MSRFDEAKAAETVDRWEREIDQLIINALIQDGGEPVVDEITAQACLEDCGFLIDELAAGELSEVSDLPCATKLQLYMFATATWQNRLLEKIRDEDRVRMCLARISSMAYQYYVGVSSRPHINSQGIADCLSALSVKLPTGERSIRFPSKDEYEGMGVGNKIIIAAFNSYESEEKAIFMLGIDGMLMLHREFSERYLRDGKLDKLLWLRTEVLGSDTFLADRDKYPDSSYIGFTYSDSCKLLVSRIALCAMGDESAIQSLASSVLFKSVPDGISTVMTVEQIKTAGYIDDPIDFLSRVFVPDHHSPADEGLFISFPIYLDHQQVTLAEMYLKAATESNHSDLELLRNMPAEAVQKLSESKAITANYAMRCHNVSRSTKTSVMTRGLNL